MVLCRNGPGFWKILTSTNQITSITADCDLGGKPSLLNECQILNLQTKFGS